MLQARSQQLQNRISSLEAMGKRRDVHLRQMIRRLDGAMQMLKAVEEMCSQQRRVLDAQNVAIMELKKERGEPADEDTGGAELGQGGEPEGEDTTAGAPNDATQDAVPDGTGTDMEEA